MTILQKIQSLLTAANTKTGESDTTLTDAVQTLIDGYGQGGGVSPFTVSAASSYSGQNLAEAFMLIVNAVVAVIGDKPFFAWLTSGNHAYEISYLLYIPESITQQKDSGLGWFGLLNRAENPSSAAHYFYSLFGGFDPVNTTASVSKMVTTGRNARIETTDVFTAIDLSDVISIT